jgi:lysyl-tRNA synthetase class 2
MRNPIFWISNGSRLDGAGRIFPTPCGSQMIPVYQDQVSEQDRLKRIKPRLRTRMRMVQSIREFFIHRGYLEVETPQLISAPAPEPHIDAVPAGSRFLHTSPELHMKRLLASDYTRIFQIGKCFRQGERGDLHLPEFSLLEWYRAGVGYHGLMEECEELILWVCEQLGTGEKIHYQGKDIPLTSPWERISVEEAFGSYASMPMELAVKRGEFDQILIKDIEPQLGMAGPTFLYDYPASCAALARLRPDNPLLAERFELYLGGIELANGFSELTDASEQRARFERDQAHRRRLGKPVYPTPEAFLLSLQHMPDAAGIALGVDRLAMILTDSARIDDVVTFAPEAG